MDPKKREEMVHKIQKLMHDHVMNIPIRELTFTSGVSPRVASLAWGLVPGNPLDCTDGGVDAQEVARAPTRTS
jgi:ABC-type transport system substrate-binding protein